MTACLDNIISDAAKKWPNKTALIEIGPPDKSITYKKLDAEVDAAARQLMANGLSSGDRAAILSQNSIGFVIVYFAIIRAGGICVVLNHTLNESEIIDRANECSVSAIYFGKGMGGKVRGIAGKVKFLQFIIEYPPRVRWGKRILPLKKENAAASIIFTTGTAGKAAGVMLSHKNLLSNAKSVAKYLNLTADSRTCCVLPFHYIYGLSLLFSHLFAGGTVVIDNRFMYPNAVLDTLEKYKVESFAGVSSHYAILLYRSDMKKRRLPSLKYYMQAGDAMPSRVTEELLDAFPGKKLYIMYGQTEASPRLTYLDSGLARKKPESVGRPVPGVKIKLINEKGRECKTGEKGEITAKGDNIMLGYWHNPKDTKKVIKNGWLYTGDIAFKDKDGDLFIVGRRKNFVKVGAHRVDPAGIERLVMKNKDIMEAAVISIPDPILGAKLKMFVSLAPDKKVDAKDIINFCRLTFPSYEVPSEIKILVSIPKNSYGKIDRERLRRI